MIVFDTGALLALDKGDVYMRARFDEATEADVPILVPAGALAQAWRGGSRQARLARALRSTEPASFDDSARAAGELCGKAGTADVIDASVALVAAGPQVRVLYTSDPDDLGALLDANGGHRPRIIAC